MAARKATSSGPSESKSGEGRAAVSADTRILILYGSDRFLQDVHLNALNEALAKEHGEGGTDTVRFDGQRGPSIIADILDECRSFGLMQQHKIILVDNADLLLKEKEEEESSGPPARVGGKRPRAAQTPRELMESYAESPSDSATLVLRASTWRPGNLDKAVIKLGPAGAVMKCEPVSTEKAIQWAQDRAKKRHNTSIDPRTAAALVGAVGTELGRIDTELEKLALAAGGTGEPITMDLVESLVGVTREEEHWAIQAALVAPPADVPAAPLRQLHDLIEISRHDPVPITWAYIEMARKLHAAARGQQQGANPWQLKGALKIWGPGADAMAEAVMAAGKAAGSTVAARLLNTAISTDAANKSSNGEPVRNLEVLTIRFAQATRRGLGASAAGRK